MANWFHTSFYMTDKDILNLIEDMSYDFEYDGDRFCGHCELKYGIATLDMEAISKIARENKSTFTIFSAEPINGVDQKWKYINGIEVECTSNERVQDI